MAMPRLVPLLEFNQRKRIWVSGEQSLMGGNKKKEPHDCGFWEELWRVKAPISRNV